MAVRPALAKLVVVAVACAVAVVVAGVAAAREGEPAARTGPRF